MISCWAGRRPIIVGKRELIAKLQQHPLKRALRADKMTLAALDATLRLYLHPEKLAERLPTLRLLTRDAASIRAQAELLLPNVASHYADFDVRIESCQSQIGSGSLPVDRLPSAALTFTRAMAAAAGLMRSLRAGVLCLRRLSGEFTMAECGWIYAVLKMKSDFWRCC